MTSTMERAPALLDPAPLELAPLLMLRVAGLPIDAVRGLRCPDSVGWAGEALRRPCGRIHWSGTETADQWLGYLDGAIQSGERAAAEVVPLLATTEHVVGRR